jgi:hypothetical protein
MVTSLPESLYEHELLLFRKPDEPPPVRTVTSDIAPTDAAILVWLRDRLKRKNRPEAELIDGILTRHIFKRLWVVSKDMGSGEWSVLVRLWDDLNRGKRHQLALALEREVLRRLQSRGISDVTRLAAERAGERLEQWTAAGNPWLLVDIPGPRPGSLVGLHYVLEGQRRALRKDDSAVGEPQISSVWDEYASDLRAAAGKIRVFCHADFVDTIEATLEWADGIAALKTVLEKAKSGEFE